MSYRPNHFSQQQQQQVRLIYPALALTQIGLSTQSSSVSPSSFQDVRIPAPTPVYNFLRERTLIDSTESKIFEIKAKHESRKLALDEKRKKQEEDELAKLAAEHEKKKEMLSKQGDYEFKDSKQITIAQPVPQLPQPAPSPSPSPFSYLPAFIPLPSKSPASSLDIPQRNSLANFRAVCGVPEKDDEKSISYLKLMNWDLNRAITVMLENNNNLQVAMAKAQTPAPAPIRPRTTIQIQRESGGTSSEEFFYDDTLWTVYERIFTKFGSEFGGRGFNLQNPRNSDTFTEGRFDLTLQQIGLIPTGNLRTVRS